MHVYGQISGQKYEFPAFTGKITHAHTVCTGPFLLLLLKGPGYEANNVLASYQSLVPRPFEEEEKGPGTHCTRMREVY